MDSGLLQKDSCNTIDEEEEEFYSLRTRQRTATKQIKRRNISTRKMANEIQPDLEDALLGENGLGLTAEEFSALPDSEREQLMEAVLLSKAEYTKQKKKLPSEQLDTSASRKSKNAMPVKLECSIPVPVVIVDASVVQKCKLGSSLNKFRLKKLSEEMAEDEVQTETVVNQKSFKEFKVNEDYVVASEMNVAKLISHDEYSDVSAEKVKLSESEPKVHVIYSKKNEDSDLRETYPEDCLVVQKSNLADLITCGSNIQLRTQSAERLSDARENSLILANDDITQVFTTDISSTLRKSETTEENCFHSPHSPTSRELIRKYHIQATDIRPLFKHSGLDLQTRMRLIHDYYTDCELRCYKSLCEINSRTIWGKPVAIKVDKGKVSTRNRRPRIVAETEQMNDRSPDKDENRALDSPGCSTCNIESEDVNKVMVSPEHSESSVATRKSFDISAVLDNIFSQDDITARLRRSRQTRIGGGLVVDEGSKICRRKIPTRELHSAASDDENDPDFTPEKKRKRIRIDNEQSQKSEKLKKRRFDVKSNCEDSRKTKEQMAENSNNSKGKNFGSDEYDLETQESINLTNVSSRRNVEKCQTPAVSNGNNSKTHSSSSSEDFYETSSTTVSRMERNKSANYSLKHSNPANDGVSNGCQVHVDLEDVLSSSPVFGRNSSLKDDARLQVFPVFQKLVRPGLRENEGNTDSSRNIPTTSKNSNSMQSEETDEYLSGDSSEGDDLKLGKSKRRQKKSRGQDPAFAKTYQKRKIKNAADQLTIISYANPSFKIPKVTQMCPMCQNDIPTSSLQEHVEKCIQLDDQKKRDQMTN